MQKLCRLDLLAEGMRLDLIHCRRRAVVQHQVHDPVGMEVTYADRPNAAGFVEFFHGPPGAVNVAVGLVNQVKVEVIELQPIERALEGEPGFVEAGVGQPQLGGDKNFFAGNAAFGNRPPYRFFVAVGRRRVDEPVADAQRLRDGRLAGSRIIHLIDAEAQHGHRDAVVQRSELHVLSPVLKIKLLSRPRRARRDRSNRTRRPG